MTTLLPRAAAARILCSLLLLPFLSSLALAQAGRGSISGLVTDQSGAIVPGAKVVAEENATGVKRSTVTTGSGLYSFISLSPGIYQVTAEAKGFQTLVQKNINVTVDQVSAVNLTLPVGSVNEVVTVTEAASLVETTNSTVGQLISSATIDRVPLLTRNVFDLVQLSAGVTPANGAPNSSSSQAISSITSGRPGVNVSSYTINGSIIGSVYYMVDGSPLGIAENNAGAIIPALDIPEDGVQETRVETQNTPASYQSGGAGVISLVTKSGTNRLHGDAFGVFRPDFLAANEYFNKQSQVANGQPNAAPSFYRYQEGGSIGGPIIRNKLFFFADYEATQQKQFDGSNTFTVPTTPERTGDFSADDFTIYNPLVPDNPDGTRQPFLNNTIANPNPIALTFLAQFPKCNAPSAATCDSDTTGALNNLYVPGLDPFTAQRFDVRLDWMKSDRQRIFGRFSFDRLYSSLVNAFGNMWDLNYAQNVTNGRNLLVADDITLNPTTVLQLRYSFTRHYENQGGDPRQNGFDITTLGFPAALAAQQVYKTLPYVNFWDVGGGIGGTANWNTFQYASENNDVNATITKTWGKHELSTGFEFMKRFLNVGQPPASSGAYAFDNTATSLTDQPVDPSVQIGGSDFASFLIGMGSTPGSESYNFTKDLFVAEANPYYAAFIEDTYHASKSLTLTVGLRWDIFGGKTERHNRLEYFDTAAANTASGVNYTGAEVYVADGNRSPFTTNMNNFGPRLGFAWQLDERMVLRGGAGFYYGPSPQMVGSASLNSDGYRLRHQLERHLLQRRRQHRLQRNLRLRRSGARKPGPQRHRHLLALQSLPQRCRAAHQFALGPCQQSRQHALDHAPLAAHAHNLQLQLRLGVRVPETRGLQRRVRRQPRALCAPRLLRPQSTRPGHHRQPRRLALRQYLRSGLHDGSQHLGRNPASHQCQLRRRGRAALDLAAEVSAIRQRQLRRRQRRQHRCLSRRRLHLPAQCR